MSRGSLGGGRGSLSKVGGAGGILGLSSTGSQQTQGRGRVLNLAPSNGEHKSRTAQTPIHTLDLDDFKPMHEAYNDPVFNSYTGSGPGSCLNQSQHVDSRREKDTIKLFVSNIPNRMSKLALENIFNLYGDAVDLFISNSQGPTTWGFVEYRKLQEAQNAIANLDRKPPHNLNVKFAKEKEQKRSDPEDINTPYCKVDTSNRGRKALPLHGTNPRKLQPSRGLNRNTLESNGYQSGQFSHYNPPAQVEVNNQVMEKNTATVRGGVVVHSGRAYVPPQPKEADTSNFQGVEKFKKPTHTEEANPPAVTCPFKQGNCTNCQAISATVCHVCKAWYCSYTCMENDWGKHKLVCRPKTVTFRPDGTIEYHVVQDEKRDHVSPTFERTRKPHGYNKSDSGKPVEVEQLTRRVSESNTTADEPKFIQPARDENPKPVGTKVDYAQHPPEPRDDGYVQTQNGFVTDRNAKYEAKIHKRDLDHSQPIRDHPDKPSKTEPKPKAASNPAPEPPIPRGVFSECLILFTTPKDEWFSVTPFKFVNEQENMMADLAEYFCQPRPSASDVSVGAICGAQFVDDLWYRVEVTAFDKDTGLAEILFIDFGNADEIPAKSLKVLPSRLSETPPMAFRIVFVGGKKPLKINDAVELTPIKPTPCGSWFVRTQEDPEPPEEVPEEEPLAVELPQDVEEKAVPPSCPLSKEKFQPVTIMHVERPGMFWVLTVEGMHGLLELNKSLADSARSRVKFTPEINQLYNYQYSGIWCRALLTCVNPHTVFFIDYGNAEEINPEDLLPLPLKLKSTPPLAIRIKLAEGTSSKYLTMEEMRTLSVRAQGKLSNFILALVEGESYVQSVLDHELAKTEEPPKPKKLNHVLSLLTPNSDAFVAVMKAIGEDNFCGALQISNCPQPYQSVNEISNTLQTKKANPSYKPVVNDDVIAKINEDPRLYRGYVMCVEEAARVALVDVGFVESPWKLAALPPEFKNIPPCGVRVSLHQPTSSSLSALLGSELTLKNIKITGDQVTADFGSYGQATISPWVPLLEEAHIPAFKLDNKGLAIITAFHSPQTVYVRPLTPDCVEAFSCVLQDVCAFCITAEPLQKPPLLGELVCARWNADGNFYRALVSQKENNSFKVIFLDFGNLETVVLDDLRSLPDNFKKIPATVVKIGLKDVPGPLFNRNATQLMNDTVAKESRVVVSHEEDLRDVVLTEESSGTVINKVLAVAMEPSWAKNPSNLCTVPPYMKSDVRYDVWEEGSKLEGIVVGAPNHHEILIVTRSPLFEYIHSVLTPQMSKYCKEVQVTAYNPRPDEFVMAKFDGDWYRAVCTSDPRTCSSLTADVFFIDYGNFGEMSIDDIRKMVPEFAHIPATVKHCKIYGLPRSESISAENKQKLTEALVALENVEIVVVKQFESGNCVVWVPALEDTLTALGLAYTRPVGFS